MEVTNGQGLLDLLRRPEFISAVLDPLLTAGSAPAPTGWEVSVAQLMGTERVTLEYRLADGSRLFLKAYDDAEEAAQASRALQGLWEAGFGGSARYRVAEPLAYLPIYQVLVMREAPGQSLATLMDADEAAGLEGMRAAARWLAALHRAPVRIGPSEDIGQGVFRLARRLAKAAARHPETEGMLIEMIEALADRAAALVPGRHLVQTHGRYHPGHVFLSGDVVTVIDLDRSHPCDPAKDVAEFLHRLYMKEAKDAQPGPTVVRAAQAFLEEYRQHALYPLVGLEYYWSYSLLATLLHTLRKRHLDPDTWERRVTYYREAFQTLPERLGQERAAGEQQAA
ncbi:MAG: phosphotransferase [Chloroflexi bacterium]|nr:phosphotransferase [Chloroflexota bacterium]